MPSIAEQIAALVQQRQQPNLGMLAGAISPEASPQDLGSQVGMAGAPGGQMDIDNSPEMQQAALRYLSTLVKPNFTG